VAHTITGMGRTKQGAFRLQPGQWTDDTSMGLCLADSLLAHGYLNEYDLLLRFIAWAFGGYNNAFRNDIRRGSVGLGGTIHASLNQFWLHGHVRTRTGDDKSSGTDCEYKPNCVHLLHITSTSSHSCCDLLTLCRHCNNVCTCCTHVFYV
jgi:hypothetical protein